MSENSERNDSNKLIRRVSYPRVRSEPKNNNFKMARPNAPDPPPLNRDHVFKMSYDTRDIHSAAIPMGSMNVMTSLKEKLAAKSATGSISALPRKNPSRVHALLQEQLGVEEEQEERFRSDQTNTIPSKVFQALQYSISEPDVQYVPPSENRKLPSTSADDEEYVRFRSDQMNTVPSKVFQALQYCYPGEEPNIRRPAAAAPVHQMREPDVDSAYERFQGNPANRVPSKVFKALQYTYDAKDPAASSEDMQFARRQDGEFQVNSSKKSVNNVPSKSFQMLQKQYSEEQESTVSTDAISADLQDALDLLEQELDAMTSAKANPVISVPLSKGAPMGRNQKLSSDTTQFVPFENKMIQVPLYKGVPKSNNYSRIDQQPVMAPPVPVRVDSKRFQQPSRNPPEEIFMEAPVARFEGVPTRPPVKHSSAKDDEIMVAPTAHVERGRRPMPLKMAKNHGKDIEVQAVASTAQIVAYSADIEKPWLAPKRNGNQRGNNPLSINKKSSSNARASGPFHKDGRTDSYDSSSSYSSIQERIPDFDPDTYLVKRRAPSTSSHGIRSDSSDSGSCHSLSSHASGGQEPRFDEDAYRIETKPSGMGRQNITIGYEQSGQQSQLDHNNRETVMQSHVNQPNQKSGILPKMNKPKKMVINVNGRTRMSESSEPKETDSDSSLEYKQPEQRTHQQTVVIRPSSHEGKAPEKTISVRAVNDEPHCARQGHCGGPHGCGETDDMKADEIKRMPTPLTNLQEMMGMIQVDAFENEVTKRGNEPEVTNDGKRGAIQMIQKEAENETETCQLKELELVKVNSEEINEVFIENEESTPFLELLKDSSRDEEFSVGNQESSGKSEDPTGPGPNPNGARRMSAVHIQSRKQQQQQISCIGSGAKHNGVFPGKRREQPKSPPVNIQMRRNSNRRSMPLDSLSITDAMKIEQINNGESLKGNLLQPAQANSLRTIRHKDNNERASLSPARPAPLRDESIIVASAMDDDEDMDEDRLQKTFEMINATADRILDQIDKVGSFSSEDYFPDDYDDHSQTNGPTADVFNDQTKTNYRLSTGSIGSSSSSTSIKENGYYKVRQFDVNDNEYDVDEMSSYCQNKRTEPEEIMSMSDDISYRVSKPLVTATTTTKRASSGVRITVPAINVKVSTARTKGSRSQNAN